MDTENKHTLLEFDKIPGGYQATITLCMLTIMLGFEDVTPSSGGYCFFSNSSFLSNALVPGLDGIFGRLSA